ncbi:MAG TPA: hypothetical protein VK507_01230 [Iamia sp.]|nr:hypothetical protein [Iamia sp.]
MARQTSPQRLEEMAAALDREAGRLDEVRLALRQDAADTHDYWEGRVADRFRVHVNGRYRQKHIDLAHDRLVAVARLLRAAARDQTPAAGNGTGGAAAPSGGARA